MNNLACCATGAALALYVRKTHRPISLPHVRDIGPIRQNGLGRTLILHNSLVVQTESFTLHYIYN